MEEMYVYPAKITRDDDVYIVRFVDFKGAVTVASDKDEVIGKAKECLADAIFDCLDKKQKLPEPSPLRGGLLYVQIWLPYYRHTRKKEVYVKKTLTLPRQLDILGKNEKINFSAALVSGVKKELNINDD